MSAFRWIASYFAKGDKATSLYKRGMLKAKKHDHQGAIDDYSLALEVPGLSPEMMAMIRYNRGLVYVACGMAKKGADDLNEVIAMDGAALNVKSAAQRKLARIESRTSRHSA
ncbi:hypothetical protein DTL42_13530 [Bremerella cremea]|uniref:Tetratricopeptide repeat protein n=1 Tax=Bremerella cremea TaxID=1031537 RepID=A0A368KQ68_9BACT|nr:hypothetical protein [Bremerella cremea]RCS48222.1 hypothetical protein DTL42_13530 [Bremerella cremea]